MKKRTVLVTGGAGLIGSQVNKLLHEAGFDTLVLDNLSTGDRRSVVRGRLIEGDVGDEELLGGLFSRFSISAVMHFASLLDVAESVRDPMLYYVNNVSKTLGLIQAVLKRGDCPLIFSSSAAVYGAADQRLTEAHPCSPVNPYGQTKWMIEQALRDADRAFGLKFCAFRYFNAAGGDPDGEIGQYNAKDPHLIPVALRSAREGRAMQLFGTDYPTPDGTCVRDYVHVHDIAAAHLLALENLLEGGKSDCFNLGNGSGFSNREVLSAVEKVANTSLKVVLKGRRPGDPASLVADAGKAEAILGWKPRYRTLESMIAHADRCMQNGIFYCTK